MAAHAAPAVCPRCAGRVRSGVEIQAAAVDLETLVLELGSAARSAAFATVLSTCAAELVAELRGEHQSCAVAEVVPLLLTRVRMLAAELA